MGTPNRAPQECSRNIKARKDPGRYIGPPKQGPKSASPYTCVCVCFFFFFFFFFFVGV